MAAGHSLPGLQTALFQQRGSTRNRHTPRMRVSSTPRLLGSSINASGILDHPPEPVIGRRFAPTRWRVMTRGGRSQRFRIHISNSRAQSGLRHSGMVRQHQTSDVQLHIGESRDSGLDASHRPGMTPL
jgi:hypothetical protein